MADYNRIAARDLGRLAVLSDGIFAVAMTLLALHERLLWSAGCGLGRGAGLACAHPCRPAIRHLPAGIRELGMFWVGQRTQRYLLAAADRSLAWIHLMFLFGIALVPFASALLARSPRRG